MAKSTTLIADTTTVITNGPNAATKAKAAAAAGPIMDYQANSKLLLGKFNESTVLLAMIITDTDASDSANLALLQGIQALLLGTSSPSTQALTDIKAVYNTGPNAATKAKAAAAAGPIMLYLGNVKGVQRKLEEASVQTGNSVAAPPTGLIQVTDSTDSANLALLQAIFNVLV